jgi:SAM-dependent methyltransferase
MTEFADRTAVANIDEQAYWNSETGRRWIAQQETLDAQLAAPTEQLLARARIEAGEDALDIGCGTGATSLAVAGRVGDQGTVLAVDISEPMLDRAAERAREAGIDNIAFQLADAQTHRFAEATVDLAVSRFGVMFFVDPVAAFANFGRALKPGGRLECVCWGPLAENPWFRIPREAAIRHLGAPEPTDPRAPGPMAFAEAAYVEAILAGAGFEGIAIEPETVPLSGLETAEAVAEFACEMGPANRLIREHEPPPETMESIRREIVQGFQEFAGPEGMRIPGRFNYLRARWP